MSELINIINGVPTPFTDEEKAQREKEVASTAQMQKEDAEQARVAADTAKKRAEEARKTAENEVATFAKSLESQLGSMTAEYQESVQEYQANESTYTELVKQDKIAEISGLEQRIQAFQGNVIKGSHKNGSQILPGKSFTVRRIASGVGVERTLPISSPSIDSLKVVRRGKVKQSNLYYLRDLTGKKARIKEAR